MSDTPNNQTPAMIRMNDPQGYLLAELGIPGITRDSVALTYAFAMREPDRVDWPLVNNAIIGRWSRSGLAYIKAEAWKLIKSKQAARDGR